MGIHLDPKALADFGRYAQLLQKWGSCFNLTSRLEPEEIISVHLLDSLALLHAEALGSEESLVDIGTGAGFPGLPLKIARRDLTVTLLESSERKSAFCRAVVDCLELRQVSVVRARAGEGSRQEIPAGFHWAVSRAAAPLAMLLRIAGSLVRSGGFLAAYKGPAEKVPPVMPKGLSDAWSFRGRSLVEIPGRPEPRAIHFFEHR